MEDYHDLSSVMLTIIFLTIFLIIKKDSLCTVFTNPSL